MANTLLDLAAAENNLRLHRGATPKIPSRSTLMKRLFLPAVFAALCTPSLTAQWFEDFDSYAPASQVVGQGGWEEWGPGSGALVSTTQSRTPANSININGPSDLVHQYSGYTSGQWVYRARQFIPTGTTGSTYFIMLNKYAYPSGPNSWSIELLFNSTTGQVSQNCGGPAVISMPFVFNAWAEIKVVIDLDQDWVQIYYNGVLFDDPAVANHVTLGGGYRWSLGDFGTNTTGLVNIGAVDLYANNASAVYYDDISLTRLKSWYEDFDAYAPASQAVGQGGWEQWGPGSGALVANTQSRSTTNSINVAGPTDLVYQYSGYTTGKWVYRTWQFIPTGMTGSSYFILLNRYAYPLGPYSWSLDLLFNGATGLASLNAGGAAVISKPFVFNQWAEIKVVIDLDLDWVQVYYNGVLFDDPAVANHATLGGGYRWTLGDFGTNTNGQLNIGAVDLFANNATSVYYDDLSLTPFEFETMGLGCPGSLPAAQLTTPSRPRLGELFNVQVNNLPQSVAFMALGFSSVTSTFGPLPFELTPAGMPNCLLRVSLDTTQLLIGAGGTANYSVLIPNWPTLLGLTLHMQALVLDPAAGNPLGAVVSDAATARFGQ